MEQSGFFSIEEMSMMSPGVCPPDPTDYCLPTQFPDLSSAAAISVDLETHDPNLPEKGPGSIRGDGYIVGAAISAWDKEGLQIHREYYPVGHRIGPNLDKEKVFQYLRDQLNYYEGELIGANILYDGDWMQASGIRPRHCKWRDIQWAEPLIDGSAPDYKLESLSKKYLGHGKITDKLKELYGGPNYIYRFREVHPGYARAYGLGDVEQPYEILQKQRKEMESLDLLQLFDLECRLAPFLLYLREQGVRISKERSASFNTRLEEKRAECLRQASNLGGVTLTTDNFGKNSTITRALDNLGIDYPRTAKGHPSIKDVWLNSLEHPFGKALAAANKYDKAKETFVDGYIYDFAVDGRVHCEFHPLRKFDEEGGKSGTVSGRFSASHPNLQNIPVRDEEIGPLCRGMFVPEEGAEWWSLDYSQIEYRFLVHYAVVYHCKDAEKAQAMYARDPNTDFHQAVSEMTGLARKPAKNLNFGLVYGMGPAKLATTLGLLDPDGKPSKKAFDLMKTYHEKAPFIKELYNKIGKMAADKGEVRTILNRRSQFELYEPRDIVKNDQGKMIRSPALPHMEAIEEYGFDVKRAHTHKALNALLQGSAADMMKKAMVDSWEAGIYTSTKDFTCSLTVHDELDGSIFPTRRGNEAYAELQNVMRTCIPLNVPVHVGAGVGKDWSKAK